MLLTAYGTWAINLLESEGRQLTGFVCSHLCLLKGPLGSGEFVLQVHFRGDMLINLLFYPWERIQRLF